MMGLPHSSGHPRRILRGTALVAWSWTCLLIMGIAGCKGGSSTEAAKGDADASQSQEAPSASVDSSTAAPHQDAVPPSASAGETGAPGGPPPPPSPATPIAPSGPPSQVVAKVNGQPITRGELDFMVKNVMREKAVAIPTDQHAEIRRRVLDDLINKELLYQKAKSSNLSVTPEELSRTMTNIKADFADEKAFNEQLRKDGMTLPGVEAIIRQGMVIDKYLTTSVKEKIKILPAEEEKFYADNKEKMKHPEQLRASHILLRADASSTAEVKQAQKTKAEEALARARKGEDFAALAKQYSQDPTTTPNGGDLGFFGKGQMVPAFDEAAWALKPGEISGVVETNYGYHIIKAIARRPEGLTPIDDVRARIHEYLVNQHVQEETQKALVDLRAQAKIDVTL